MYRGNPKYKHLFKHDIYDVYFLQDANITELHKSREVEANLQNIYSNSGATAAYIGTLCSQGLKMLENDPKGELLRTNMISILNQLLYRTKNPVDSLCGIRMGAILSFLEYEVDGRIVSEPEDAQFAWIDKKVGIAQANPEAYTFFLHWGIANTPSYYSRLDTLSEANYFAQREEILNSLKACKQE